MSFKRMVLSGWQGRNIDNWCLDLFVNDSFGGPMRGPICSGGGSPKEFLRDPA
jgi:hypothetical protein